MEYEETWTKEQVLGFAAATYVAAREMHMFRYRPDPEIGDPILGTVLAIMRAESKEAEGQVIKDFEDRQRYDPLDDTEAPDSPGRRILLGFNAARAALFDATDYSEATEIVSTFNESAVV